MGSEDYDDSSGKHRRQDAKTRSGLLISALLAGVCLGVVFAERLYIHYQEVDQGSSAQSALSSVTGGGRAARKLGQVPMLCQLMCKLLCDVGPCVKGSTACTPVGECVEAGCST